MKQITLTDGTHLVASQNIEYKPSADDRVTVGTICQFRMINNESPWMQMQDLETGDKEWISLTLWLEHKKNGLFNFKLKENDTSQQPANIPTDDLW